VVCTLPQAQSASAKTHNRAGGTKRAQGRFAVGAAEFLLAFLPRIGFPGLTENTSRRRRPDWGAESRVNM
jgi:hypothetical protein